MTFRRLSLLVCSLATAGTLGAATLYRGATLLPLTAGQDAPIAPGYLLVSDAGAIAALGAGGFIYYQQRDYIDINVEYQLRKNLSVFAVGRNITNVPQDFRQYSPQTPRYADYQFGEEFGVQFNFGIKGSF